MATPEEIALKRSRENKAPNVDFSKALDLGLLGKIKGLLGYGSTCTNTATSFYYPNRTTAGSMNLLTNPNEAGFKIINQQDAVPGSLIIMSEPNGAHRHTAIFDSVWEGDSYYNQYGDRVEAGDTLINYSNGKREPEHYRIRRPINKVFPERTKHTYLKSMRNGSKLIPRKFNIGGKVRKYQLGASVVGAKLYGDKWNTWTDDLRNKFISGYDKGNWKTFDKLYWEQNERDLNQVFLDTNNAAAGYDDYSKAKSYVDNFNINTGTGADFISNASIVSNYENQYGDYALRRNTPSRENDIIQSRLLNSFDNINFNDIINPKQPSLAELNILKDLERLSSYVKSYANNDRWKYQRDQANKLFGGIFNSAEDVAAFLRANGLAVDGLVGQNTLNALNKKYGKLIGWDLIQYKSNFNSNPNYQAGYSNALAIAAKSGSYATPDYSTPMASYNLKQLLRRGVDYTVRDTYNNTLGFGKKIIEYQGRRFNVPQELLKDDVALSEYLYDRIHPKSTYSEANYSNHTNDPIVSLQNASNILSPLTFPTIGRGSYSIPNSSLVKALLRRSNGSNIPG